VRVTYCEPGTTNVAATATVTADATGRFARGPVSPGNYDVRVKLPQGLSCQLNDVLVLERAPRP
jgi:hypothetical protein